MIDIIDTILVIYVIQVIAWSGFIIEDIIKYAPDDGNPLITTRKQFIRGYIPYYYVYMFFIFIIKYYKSLE